MNLARIEIENFKQYVQPIAIDIPREAVVGIIGSNGAGKTTLFQAIEWCLYAPRSIPTSDIRPRGRAGKPRVAVTLESGDGSTRWLIERELPRSGSAQAKLYRIEADGSESIVVQGPREVTSFVANHLIGLPHDAFVATFFTRQKELHFFGDLKDTDRRREVGKLLGLETIQKAHIIIGELRTEAVNRARALKAQIEGDLEHRDLEAERAELESILQVSEHNVSAATAREKEAELARVTAAAQRDVAMARRDQDRDLRAQIERVQAEERNQVRRVQQREDELVHLQQLATEREHLQPVAHSLAETEKQVAEAETARSRFEQRTQLLQQRDQHRSQQTAVATQIEEISSRVLGEGQLRLEESVSPNSTLERLQQAVARTPLADLEQKRTLSQQAIEAQQNLVRAQTTHASSLELQTSLMQQQQDMLAPGDPIELINALQTEMQAIAGEDLKWKNELDGLVRDRERRERILRNISQSNFEEGCPTCGRPFSEHDADEVAHVFHEDIQRFVSAQTDGETQQRQRDQRKSRIQQELSKLQELRTALDTLRTRIEKSVGVIEGQRTQLQELEQRVQQSCAALGVSEPPTAADVAQLEQDISRIRAITDAVNRVEVLLQTHNDLAAREREVEVSLKPLSDATFDVGTYRALLARRDESTRAIARIESLDQQLARRDQITEDRDTLNDSIRRSQRLVVQLRGELFEIGHDPEVLDVLEQEMADCEQRVGMALRERHSAEVAHREQLVRMESLVRDIEQRRTYVERADRAQRDADELVDMYNIFRQFDQWVVTRLTPQLGNLTSDLVETVTDGKYTEVTFDQNFGVMVRDGDDTPFPLATFSGGERDAIALCARLALSQMIGQQAHDQTAFLVLDEVFGSLDRERRSRLLELFGTISGATAHFQQLFIISHVDDVRTAPTLDELWLIEESGEGLSSWSRLESGDDIGEL